jgi:hypothetical protein
VSGGAYGAFCQLGQRSGTVQLLSYRDPNVMATFDVFARAGDALVDIVSNMSDNDLELAVIGAIGDLDSPLSAAQKGFESFLRWAAGETPEHRLAWRAQVHRSTVLVYLSLNFHVSHQTVGVSVACSFTPRVTPRTKIKQSPPIDAIYFFISLAWLDLVPLEPVEALLTPSHSATHATLTTRIRSHGRCWARRELIFARLGSDCVIVIGGFSV